MKNLLKNITTSGKTFLALSILALNVGTYADDTEVFYSLNVSKPNLLFVLDVSGSMRGIVVDGTDNTTFTQTISIGGNDSFQARNPASAIFTGTQEIDLSTATYVRLRFDNIGIPQNAQIQSADIQFTASADTDGDADFQIWAEAEDNAPTIQNIFNPGLYAGPYWENVGEWEEGDRGDDQKTIDLLDLVSAVVARPGWEANNAMAFYFRADGASRHFAAFEH